MMPAAYTSKHFGARQFVALTKIGNHLLPGDGELPSFSQSGCVAEIDRMLDYMPAQDRADLKLLLGILSYLPPFAIAGLMNFLERYATRMPAPLGGLLRKIRLGLRGVVMTLYYATPRAHQVLGYQVSVYTADLGR